jgi:hypothetical protein
MNRGTCIRWVFVLSIASATLSVGAAGALAQTPIGPDQHFVGLVNGSKAPVTVDTVCPGPVGKGHQGPVAGGQTMSVAEVSRSRGFTGPFSDVYSWFVPRHDETPVELTFSAYGDPQMIPSTVRVPCSGTGRAEFSSCPYLAPCAAGWVPTYVRVTFVDIAA